MSNEHHKIQQMPEGREKRKALADLKNREDEAERERLKIQNEKEEAERKEAAEKRRLLSQIPDLERRFNAINQRMQSSEQKLSDASKSLSSISNSIDTTRRELAQLRDYQSQLQQSLVALQQDEKALSSKISSISSQVKIVEQQSSKLLKHWGDLLRDAEKAGVLSQKAISDLKQVENDLNDSVKLLNNTNYLIQETENKTIVHRKIVSNLENRYLAISEEINLLKNSSAIGIAAFVEMETLRKQGYELRGIVSGKEINLWFEEINGKHRVAIKLRNMVENQGISWLKELDLNGFDKISENEFIQDHVDYLDEYGVTLKYGEKRKFPRTPPPPMPNIEERTNKLNNQNKA